MNRACLVLALLGPVLGAAAPRAAQRILFMSLRPSTGRLFVARADGSDERPLTAAGAVDYNPSWSARGDWVVFTSERGVSAVLYRIHPDGTGLEQLTDDPASMIRPPSRPMLVASSSYRPARADAPTCGCSIWPRTRRRR